MKRILRAVLLTFLLLLMASQQAEALGKGKVIITVEHCDDYIEVGQKLYFKVGVKDADKFRSIRYQWMFSTQNIMGPQSSSGCMNWTFGDTDDGFFYAETVDWLSGGQTDTLTLSQETTDILVKEEEGFRYVYKCRVTVDGEEYYSPLLYTIVIPERLADSVRIKGLQTPVLGKKADRKVLLYGNHTELEKLEWLRKKNDDSGWTVMEETEAFTEGLYAANIYVRTTDDYHFNYQGNTEVFLNDQKTAMSRYRDGDDNGIITRTFQVTEKTPEGQSSNTDYTCYKAGNFYRVKWTGNLGKNAWVPDGAIVTVVDASDPKKALVRYDGKDDYVLRSCLEFYGYGDGSIESAAGKNYVTWAQQTAVTWGSPTGRTIALLPPETVVTALSECYNGYIRFRYGGYICYAPIQCFEEAAAGIPATDIDEFIHQAGFYRVTAASVNVRAEKNSSAERVAGLKKGDVVYAEDGTDENWLAFTYNAKPAYVNKAFFERVPFEEYESLDPVITQDLQDVTVKAGETAVFSFEVSSPVYREFFDGNVLVGSRFQYGFAPLIAETQIVANGWGKVESSPESNQYRILNCSEELDGMLIVGLALNYGFTVTRTATLHVLHSDTKKEDTEPVIDSSGASISFINKRSMCFSSPDGIVLEEGMDENGNVMLELFPNPGEVFTEESAEKVRVNTELFRLSASELLQSGALRLRLSAKAPENSTAGNPELLSLKPVALKLREGEAAAFSLTAENTTGAEVNWELAGGELPQGISLENGMLSGIAAKESAGVFRLTVKAKTSPVTARKTEQKVRQEQQTYTEAETGRIDVTLSKNEVDTIKNAIRGHGELQRGYYTYILDLFDDSNPLLRYFRNGDYTDGGNCGLSRNADGSWTLSHQGLRDVQKTRTVDVSYTEETETEVYPACEAQAEIILTVVPEHKHTFKKQLKQEQSGSCEEGLIYEYICECGEKQEIQEGREHDYSHWYTAEGDCDTGLLLERVCSVCGRKEEKRLKPTEHSDLNGDGICDRCFRDESNAILAALLGVSEAEIEDGSALETLKKQQAAEAEAFRTAGLAEAGETGETVPEGKDSPEPEPHRTGEQPVRLFRKVLVFLPVLLILLAVGAGAGRKKKRQYEKQQLMKYSRTVNGSEKSESLEIRRKDEEQATLVLVRADQSSAEPESRTYSVSAGVLDEMQKLFLRKKMYRWEGRKIREGAADGKESRHHEFCFEESSVAFFSEGIPGEKTAELDSVIAKYQDVSQR